MNRMKNKGNENEKTMKKKKDIHSCTSVHFDLIQTFLANDTCIYFQTGYNCFLIKLVNFLTKLRH